MADQDKSHVSTSRSIGLREFRDNFSGIMREVRGGASFVVTSREGVVAFVHPPRPRRQAGTMRGAIEMMPDFDDGPPELLEALEAHEG